MSGERVAPPKSTWIFILHETQNPRLCKVGITTTRPQARMSGMQSSNPRPLKLAAVLRVTDRDRAFEIDRALKERLARLRNVSGWFAADADRIVAELREAAAACGSTVVLEPAFDHTRGTHGGTRAGAGRPKNTPSSGKAAPASP